MDFQQSYTNKHQNYNDIISIFSESLEIYDSDIFPFSQSSMGNSSVSYSNIEADLQAGNISDHAQHYVLQDVYNQMINRGQHEKQPSFEHINGVVFNARREFDSSQEAPRSRKQRMKWTEDLHQQFVECVNRLGGVEKATPKAILKLMKSNMLTIFHVKSHLQKYRTSKHIAECRKEISENRTALGCTLQLDMRSGMQINEALQLVNRSLHEQLEIQQNLQMLIEEQGKQLKMMLDQQQETNKNLFMSSLRMSDYPIQNGACDSTFKDDHTSITEGSGSSQLQSDK